MCEITGTRYVSACTVKLHALQAEDDAVTTIATGQPAHSGPSGDVQPKGETGTDENLQPKGQKSGSVPPIGVNGAAKSEQQEATSSTFAT